MICVTIIQCVLIHQEIYAYLDWYFGFMGFSGGGYIASKFIQNLALSGKEKPVMTKTEVKENEN